MKLFRSFGYALTGIGKAIASELNIKVQLAAGSAAIILGFVFKISKGEWLAIVLCLGTVLTAELLNTAIEKLLNFIHPQHHPEVGTIKDISAGAVFLAATCSVVIALIVFVPYLLKLWT
ncbi:MAG: diacylglycerol kinase family protein [Cyclobacteriaceae bacterium]|nr:MAG: diacylglycerol kinase family protein [Cyclobacteriaceae bacterium]